MICKHQVYNNIQSVFFTLSLDFARDGGDGFTLCGGEGAEV